MLNSGHQDGGFYKSMWKTISDGHIWHHKVVNKRKDGTLYPAMLTISPLVNEQGEITNFIGSHTDLSDLERMENNFHQAQKMEAIGTLVGGIAHDFNNILAAMTGNLYLARQYTRDMPDVVQKLANVESLSFRAADMIQQLLTFARKSMVNMKPIPLVPFIKETLKTLHLSVPENIKICQNICREALSIEGDATQLHQVLMNLINNARDAVEDVADPVITVGITTLRIDKKFLELHPEFTAGPCAHLSVQDNGCGIPEQLIEHLFDPFFTTKDIGKGTGLGLAMTFGAIQMHHGLIEVESIEGEGSTFHIYLPLLESDEGSFALRQETTISRGDGEWILMADDEQHIIETGKAVLESLGYRVLTATDGRQAVEIFKARSEEIDLCIFDIVMPVLGGDKAAQLIRQISKRAKIIFTTGYDRNLLSGMKGETVLTKPFAIEEISHIIKQQLKA